VARIVPALELTRASREIDLPGVLLAVPAVALLLYALVGAGDAGWASLATLGPIGVAAVLLSAFVWRERTAREPLVRLGLLRDRFLTGGLMVIVAASALLAGTFFLVSLYLQRMAGLSPLDAGLLFLPVAIALIVGAQAGSGLTAHAGGRTAIVLGLAVASAGLFLLSRIPDAANVLVDVVPGFVLAGLGIGATLAASMTTAFTRVADADAGLASALVNTSHEVGFAVGVSVLSTLASASIAGQGVSGFQFAFGAAVAVALISAAASLVVLPRDRASVAGRAFAH
jgi:predicted MFS family arabinose efflux permease